MGRVKRKNLNERPFNDTPKHSHHWWGRAPSGTPSPPPPARCGHGDTHRGPTSRGSEVARLYLSSSIAWTLHGHGHDDDGDEEHDDRLDSCCDISRGPEQLGRIDEPQQQPKEEGQSRPPHRYIDFLSEALHGCKAN